MNAAVHCAGRRGLPSARTLRVLRRHRVVEGSGVEHPLFADKPRSLGEIQHSLEDALVESDDAAVLAYQPVGVHEAAVIEGEPTAGVFPA